jgi:hypothetical protein
MSLSCRLSLVLLIVVALLLAGCSGSKSSVSNSNLTQAQAQTVAQAVSLGVSQAVLDSYNSVLIAGSTSFLKARKSTSGLQIDSMSAGQASSSTCTGDTTSAQCTVSYTSKCSGGGSISITGSASGSVNASGTGSAKGQLELTPTSCDVVEYKILLNGEPNITLSSQVNIVNNDASSWPIVVTENGAVSFGPDSGSSTIPSGACQVNMNYSFTRTGLCTMGGTMCGKTVSGSCY